MSEVVSAFGIKIEQVSGYEFRVTFDKPQHPSLLMDEPEPLGDLAGIERDEVATKLDPGQRVQPFRRDMARWRNLDGRHCKARAVQQIVTTQDHATAEQRGQSKIRHDRQQQRGRRPRSGTFLGFH